jgi:hypothetical protein
VIGNGFSSMSITEIRKRARPSGLIRWNQTQLELFWIWWNGPDKVLIEEKWQRGYWLPVENAQLIDS